VAGVPHGLPPRQAARHVRAPAPTAEDALMARIVDPTNQSTAAPQLLVVQTEGEQLQEVAIEVGWNVMHHTNNPLPWLDDLINLLSINAVLVSPLALTVDSIALDLTKVMDLVKPVYLYVDGTHWLELTHE
jgi:hypothetical protein